MNLLRWLGGLVLVCVGIIALEGCVDLEVNKFEGTGTDTSRAGYAYMLDFTQYEITITRTLLECPMGQLPKIKVEAAATASLVPDGAQVYVIDPQSLIGAFKISDMTVDFKDGRLVGFNSVVEDKTADVIKSVAATAGKIALLTTGIPAPIDGSGAPVIGCSADATKKLANREVNKKLLADATEALNDANVALIDLTTRYTFKPTKELAEQLKAQKGVVEGAKKSVDGLQKQITEANTALSRVTTMTWPDTSATFDSDPVLPLDVATMTAWFDDDALRKLIRDKIATPKILTDDNTGIKTLVNDGTSGNAARLELTEAAFALRFPKLTDPNFDIRVCSSTPAIEACTQLEALRDALVTESEVARKRQDIKLNMVSFHLAVRGSYGSTKLGADATTDSKAGLRYRVPASGWLYVCEGQGNCDRPEEKNRIVLRQADTIAQLGAVFNLPFSSPAFASGSMSVSFDEKGRLLKGQLKRTNAAALSAADSAGSIADQALAFEKAKNAAPLTELNRELALAKAQKELNDAEKALVQSPKDSLNEELAILEAQKKVNDARAVLGGDRGVELQSQLEITKLEVALAEQRKKLAEDPNASDSAVAAQYAAQTAVLNAQKTKFEAEAALIAAQRALEETKAEK